MKEERVVTAWERSETELKERSRRTRVGESGRMGVRLAMLL